MAGRIWKDGRRQGIAYVENREMAEQVMALRSKTGMLSPSLLVQKKSASTKSPVLPPGAMAVYADKKGRPFAWQIAFALGDWEKVTALLGIVDAV